MKAFLYECVYSLLWFILKLVSRGGLSAQMKNRAVTEELLLELNDSRSSQKEKRYLFYCSSAGEYEQSRPMMNEISKNPNSDIFIFFFSLSGYRFARASGEKHRFYLCPPDRPSQWRKIFNAYAPQISVVSRYELWPGFLSIASKRSKVILINLSRSQHRKSDGFWKKYLLKKFDHIFISNRNDIAHYQKLLPKVKISYSGDTKYDRVLERLHDNVDQISFFKKLIHKTFGERTILILGSAWPEEVQILLELLRNWDQNSRESYAYIIAPHSIEEDNLALMEAKIRESGLDVIRFSRWMSSPDLATGGSLILIDVLGKLPEVYGGGDLCMVGGGLSRKVHNVLEPASHGLDICFGKNFQSQNEAVQLVESGIATVVNSAEDLHKWLSDANSSSRDRGRKAHEHVLNMAGATKIIMKEINL